MDSLLSIRVILREAPATPGPSYRSSRSSRRGPAPAPPPRPIRRPAPQPPPRPAPPRPPPPGHGTLGTRQHSRNRSFGEELVTDHLFPTTEALVDVGLVGLHSGHVLDRQQLSLGTARRGVSAVMVQYLSFRKARTGRARRASTQPDPRCCVSTGGCAVPHPVYADPGGRQSARAHAVRGPHGGGLRPAGQPRAWPQPQPAVSRILRRRGALQHPQEAHPYPVPTSACATAFCLDREGAHARAGLSGLRHRRQSQPDQPAGVEQPEHHVVTGDLSLNLQTNPSCRKYYFSNFNFLKFFFCKKRLCHYKSS